MIKRSRKRKKKINYIAPVIIIIVLIAAGWGLYFYLDRNKVSFKEDVVKVNIGEEIYNTDNLDKDYDIKKEKIDTSKMGEQEVSIKIKGKEYN
jgi:flagellar basal body-associated protein FliL